LHGWWRRRLQRTRNVHDLPSTGCPPGTTAGASAAALVAEETPALSLDGRYVAYTAAQSDRAQVFLRDYLRRCCRSLPAAYKSGLSGSRWHSREQRKPRAFLERRRTLCRLQLRRDESRENAPPGRQVYLLDTCAGAGDSCKPATHLNLHRFETEPWSEPKAFCLPSALRGASSRFWPSLRAIPRILVSEDARERPEQRPPPGVHTRYLSWCRPTALRRRLGFRFSRAMGRDTAPSLPVRL